MSTGSAVVASVLLGSCAWPNYAVSVGCDGYAQLDAISRPRSVTTWCSAKFNATEPNVLWIADIT